jgi:hypothetical protein
VLEKNALHSEALTQASGHARMAAGRADHAEAMVKLQARTVERLLESNERLTKLVGDMRRVGFGILEPIETSDTPATTADYDREAVEQNPELGADDDG